RLLRHLRLLRLDFRLHFWLFWSEVAWLDTKSYKLGISQLLEIHKEPFSLLRLRAELPLVLN
ncbi:MAG: hypothetical protein KDI79_27805, partial [Anaerolineae bacterium]|nr:hypothetical protein [Anaerolineae bacterium]